ncbi:threonylcarbamoyl-AMP synthase [Tersicoccus solisilvae]|uniref:L-threonylcarbamoyladenylate synthase n=1 Tax=Tersicoccus solisilvae TaxID=1882339 RepID=A0ABQ1PAF5_9MICC|nr:L-threonylcarbamoyladenylate synthase [Tersicoccus solisilvae]GGC92142.1 threonylcarbamoyl-AMP synthase [Tersicoccus solisilvae]
MSEIIDCTDDAGRAEGLARAHEVVAAQECIVLPTDTVYGIGADAFSPRAVATLLAAKGRGRNMPPPVLVARPEVLDGLATEVPQQARDLAAAFWPGPLTLILRAQPSLTWDLGETRGTVALRMPDDPIALDLLGLTGPLAVSSANRTGNPAASTAAGARDQLGDAVGLYLDGGSRGENVPSTIVDCTGEPFTIVRIGALSPERLREVVPEIVDGTAVPQA